MTAAEAVRMNKLSKRVKRKKNIIGQWQRLREKEISNEKMKNTGSSIQEKRIKEEKLKN